MQETQMWMMIISSEEPYKTYKIQHIPMLTVPRWNNENEVGIPTVEVRQPSSLPPIKKKIHTQTNLYTEMTQLQYMYYRNLKLLTSVTENLLLGNQAIFTPSHNVDKLIN